MTRQELVLAHGGLANRLRVLLSYRAAHGPTTFIWRADSQVAGGRFQDVFERLDGVTIIDGIVAKEPDVSTCDPSPDAPAGWQQSYADLVLKPWLEVQVERLASPIAIHVRRTDIVDLNIPLEPLADYFAFLREHTKPGLLGEDRVFVATDNHETQAMLRDMLRERCICQPIDEHGDLPHDHRATSLEHAAIDMFTCARAEWFKGTSASAFTWAIEILRSLRK